MELTLLINHPEQMDRETLYELRSTLALYPYFQTARLLMLQNLYLLHDPTFDEELRRAAVYITDRRVIFDMIEAAHYKLRSESTPSKQEKKEEQGSRTISLIDDFLESIPKEDDNTEKTHRKPTPADAAIDYVSYLIQSENEEDEENGRDRDKETPQMKGQNLIDDFIRNDTGKIQLNENPEYLPQLPDSVLSNEKEGEETYFTETLAKIYIKQGRYSKALEIIRRLSLDYPKKNAYFADQIRFLEKLIINNKNK